MDDDRCQVESAFVLVNNEMHRHGGAQLRLIPDAKAMALSSAGTRVMQMPMTSSPRACACCGTGRARRPSPMKCSLYLIKTGSAYVVAPQSPHHMQILTCARDAKARVTARGRRSSRYARGCWGTVRGSMASNVRYTDRSRV